MIEFGKFLHFREHGFSNSVKKLVFRTFFLNANNSQFVNMLFYRATLCACFISFCLTSESDGSSYINLCGYKGTTFFWFTQEQTAFFVFFFSRSSLGLVPLIGRSSLVGKNKRKAVTALLDYRFY